MDDEREFDWVLGKIPRCNRMGEDISDLSLGSGGRRNADGTMAGMAYDLNMYDPNDSEDIDPDRDDLSKEDFAKGVLTGVAVAYGGYKALKWIAPMVKRKFFSSGDKKDEEIAEVEINGFENGLKRKTEIDTVADFTELDTVCEAYHKDMSNKEIQRHLVNIAFHKIQIMHELKQLEGVYVTEDDFTAAIMKLTSLEIVNEINTILSDNPTLLCDYHSQMLSEILKRDIIVEGEYIPVGQIELKNAFNINS